MQLLDTGATKGSYDFLSTDNKELFEKNLILQPDDWIWRKETIQYDLNSQGYRCNEWDQYDWNNSIIIMGGSDVFGIGVKESQTVSKYIENLTGYQTINLGANAVSPMFMWINSIILAKKNIKPVAMIYIWTDPSRMSEFVDDAGIQNKKCGVWSNQNEIGYHWATHRFQGYQFLRYFMLNIDQLWNCPCKQYPPLFVDLPWINMTDELKLPTLDNSRDVVPNSHHFGPVTYKAWAEKFVNDLKLPF